MPEPPAPRSLTAAAHHLQGADAGLAVLLLGVLLLGVVLGMVGHGPALHHDRRGPRRLGSQGGGGREPGLRARGQALGQRVEQGPLPSPVTLPCPAPPTPAAARAPTGPACLLLRCFLGGTKTLEIGRGGLSLAWRAGPKGRLHRRSGHVGPRRSQKGQPQA